MSRCSQADTIPNASSPIDKYTIGSPIPVTLNKDNAPANMLVAIEIDFNDFNNIFFVPIDLPPKKESSYNVSKIGQKGGTNGQEELHSGTDYQQASGS